MRQSLTLSGLAFLLGGCSIIYNPDHITGSFDGAIDSPPIDAPRPIDANPAGLTLTQVDSPILLEGQGTGASRKALLVIEGTNITAGATVTIDGAPSVIPDATAVVATTNSDLIAVPVTAMIHSGTMPSPTAIPLTVTVTQMSDGNPVTATIGWKLQELPELVASTGAVAIDNTNVVQYSHVALSGNSTLSFTSATTPVILRTIGDLSIQSTGIPSLSVSTAATSAGVFGGGTGGAVGGNGSGILPGPGQAGDANDGGGGAGFAGDGTSPGGTMNQGKEIGDPLITSYSVNGGSGGGGGQKGALGGGSVGGGAGGTIELSAGGDLTAPAVTANGADGANCSSGSAGGGGSGGVIVLRAGNVASINGVSVAHGNGGTSSLLGNASGGPGSDGRARVDGATINGSTVNAVHGAVFDPTTPQVVSTSQVMVTVDGASSANMFELHDVDNNYEDLAGTTLIPVRFAAPQFTTPVSLVKGMNRLCMSPPGGPGNEESRNCVYVAYLP